MSVHCWMWGGHPAQNALCSRNKAGETPDRDPIICMGGYSHTGIVWNNIVEDSKDMGRWEKIIIIMCKEFIL